jgi:hypothetical protein
MKADLYLALVLRSLWLDEDGRHLEAETCRRQAARQLWLEAPRRSGERHLRDAQGRREEAEP